VSLYYNLRVVTVYSGCNLQVVTVRASCNSQVVTVRPRYNSRVVTAVVGYRVYKFLVKYNYFLRKHRLSSCNYKCCNSKF